MIYYDLPLQNWRYSLIFNNYLTNLSDDSDISYLVLWYFMKICFVWNFKQSAMFIIEIRNIYFFQFFSCKSEDMSVEYVQHGILHGCNLISSISKEFIIR